jgi:hypothetical protein
MRIIMVMVMLMVMVVKYATPENLIFLNYGVSLPKHSYMYTWNSADGKNGIQIDHILINWRGRSRILNVRYFRGILSGD